MDAYAQLALMVKAKRVFESPDTFLSFPALSPLSYLPEELTFGSAGEMTTQDLAEASEYARTTNQIPRSLIAPIAEGEYLWDVYGEVLRTARLATTAMSAADREKYDAALAVLYAPGEGGLRTDSEQLRSYKQHRDAVIEAQEEYKNQQLTAEASTDAAVLERWKNEDEPRLRAAVAEREAAWVTAGFKNEIEAAQQLELAGAAGAAVSVWNEWKTSFLDDLDLATDTNMIRFAITGYSPYDIFEADNWPRFTLSADEMRALADQAPPQLLEIFAAGSNSSEIESVSFEYRSAGVTRPWFTSAVFKSRFWNLPAGSEPLSDGTETLAGRCPSYIAALVFARNIVVKYKEQAGGGTETSVSPTKFLRLQATMLRPQFMHLAKPAPVHTESAALPAGDQPAPASASIDVGRAALRLKGINFSGAATALKPLAVATPHLAAPRLAAGLRIRAMVDRPVVAAPTAVAPEPERPPDPPAPSRSGEVMVLAFICKRVPRSPDPDPNLAW